MNAVFRGKVSAGWASIARGLPMFHFHQAGYSEIEPEGRTLVESCDRLLDLLVRAIESACRAPKYPPLRLALVDPRAVDPRCRNRA
jgi:hypothetical protein